MSSESQEIKIIGVDKDAIKVSMDTKDFWEVPFKLSAKPDSNWEKRFYEVQQKDRNTLKRRARVNEGSIKVEVSEIDDLQKILEVLKIEVAEANVLCEEEHQKKMKIRLELENLQQKQRDSTQKFKEACDQLKF